MGVTLSVQVPLDELGERLAEYPWCFVVTVGDGGAHLLSVAPSWEGGRYRCAVGGSTRRNVAAGSAVTLGFSPASGYEFSLLVDGTAEVDGDDIVVTPTAAVLHRPAQR